MSSADVQTSTPWMDKTCLELWLSTTYGNVTVNDIEVVGSSAKGDNYLSDMRRLVVKTKEGDSYSLIVKSTMEDGTVAGVMKDSCIFKKEQEMYGHTLPRIHTLLQKSDPDNFEPVAPICVYACKSFLIMEDLTASGFKMLNRRQGLNLEQCLAVMRSLAEFHAASVVLHKKDPNSMKKYQIGFWSDPAVGDSWEPFFSGTAKILAEELDSWSKEWKPYAEKLRKIADSMLPKVREACEQNENGFNVLLHGDVWVNNLMFQEEINSVRLIDFQLAHFTTPVIDLHYFMSTSTAVDVNINHRDTLLQEYHKSLCSTLTTLGYAEKLISLDELREEFDKKSIYGLFSMISPYSVMQSDPKIGFSFDDLLGKGIHPGPKIYGENYKKAVKHLLPVFESKGVFDNI